jgi:hypothetical protein
MGAFLLFLRMSERPPTSGGVDLARFLIELAHEAETVACARIVQVFLQSGSHFLTNAEWGCMDGDHRAWIIVDVPSKEDARAIVPPAFRAKARIVALNSFSIEQINAVLAELA